MPLTHHSPATPSLFIGSQMQCGLALNMAKACLSAALTRWRGRGAMTASSHNTACALLGEYLRALQKDLPHVIQSGS